MIHTSISPKNETKQIIVIASPAQELFISLKGLQVLLPLRVSDNNKQARRSKKMIEMLFRDPHCFQSFQNPKWKYLALVKGMIF